MGRKPSPLPKKYVSGVSTNALSYPVTFRKQGRQIRTTNIDFLLSLKLEKMGSTFVDAEVGVSDTWFI